VAVLILGASAAAPHAQDPDAPAPAFEVVSVKPNDSGDTRTSSMVQPGARYTATNMTLGMLIKTAYQVHDDQIVGGPDWLNADRFDITARGDGNPSTTAFVTQARLMLRSALTDRFRLTLYRETREIPIYTLVFARRDARFGRQFRRTDPDGCSGAAKPLPSPSDALEPVPDLPCGGGFSRAGHLGGRGADFAVLVRALSTWTDRVLIDRTGLAGRFDWDLQWTPEPPTPGIAIVPNRLPLVTAMQDQLGFRLEPGRAPAEVLVIDRAERPTPD
jgi:uncharacterized protein (TIGR03435 family)